MIGQTNGGNLTINSINPSDKWLIANGTDFNNLKAIGNYYVPNKAALSTMTNTPTANAGVLQVFTPLRNSPNGYTPSGAYVYEVQEFTTYFGEKYSRWLMTNGDGVWSYGSWTKVITTGNVKSATISGTTTQSGALLIPSQYQSKPILEVYCNPGTALVYRRDTAYLMFANTLFQPLSNQQVSAKIWYLDI